MPQQIKDLIKGSFFLIAAVIILFTQKKVFAKIIGSPHDFSEVSFGHSPGKICEACHIPHNSGSGEVPLWRGSPTSYGPYILYSSNTLNAQVNQPLAPTKTCLACHDGTIALSKPTGCIECHKSFHNTGNVDLSNDHPVSIVYNSALARSDDELKDPSTTTVTSLGDKTIETGMLYQGRLECVSCHDVHAAKGDSASAPKLLLVNNQKSKLCLTCHNK